MYRLNVAKQNLWSTIVLLQHLSDPSPIIAQGECDGQMTYEEKKVKMVSVTTRSF